MPLQAISIRAHSDGPAYWRVVATTSAGEFFVKLPLLDPVTGHDGPWKEFISLRVACRAGLPFLGPEAVHVARSLVPSERAIHWDHGEVFCGTPWKRLTPSDLSALTADQRVVLFGIDNLLHNMDRARSGASRNDVWRNTDGSLVLLDLDMVELPLGADALPTDYFAWFSPFLVRELGFRRVQDALISIHGSLGDAFFDETVAEAGAIWPRVNVASVAAWLRGRRDSIQAAALRAETDKSNAPPWFLPRA